MSNYTETKKQLDRIRSHYTCSGDIIFTSAMQMVIEQGQVRFKDNDMFTQWIADVDAKHDKAEAEGKWLFMTRDFEKSIMECAKEIADVNTYDLMVYIQKEMWLSGGEVGEPNYQRAMQIIRNCLCYTADRYGVYPEEVSETLYKFREMELTDEEIAYFGWEYLFDVEEEE